MSVVSSREIRDGRGGTYNDKFERTHTRAFLVLTDNPEDDDFDAGSGALTATPDPIPERYDIHPSDPTAYCNSLDIKPDGGEDGKGWIVTASYTNKIDPQQNEPNPEDRPPQVTWSFAQFQTIAEQDKDDKAIVNTLKQQFNPPPEKDASNIILNYTRFEGTFSPSLAIQYQDTVNATNFLGAPARTAKLQSITANQVYEDGDLYWQVSYEIHFRRDTWTKKILNRGTKFKPTAGSTVVHEVTDREPVNLKSDGTKVTPGSTVGIHYVDAYIYEETNFDNLNIVLP